MRDSRSPPRGSRGESDLTFQRDLELLRWAPGGWGGAERGRGGARAGLCGDLPSRPRLSPARVWAPGRKGGRAGPRGGYCEVDGEEPCVAVIPRAGGHEGFAGLEGPAPGIRLEVASWGAFPARGLAFGSTAARGVGGRREAGVSGTVSGEEKRVGSEGSRRANSPLQNAREE